MNLGHLQENIPVTGLFSSFIWLEKSIVSHLHVVRVKSVNVGLRVCAWMCVSVNLKEWNCFLEGSQIKQHDQGTSRPDMKLDFNNYFYFMQREAGKETKPWEKKRNGASYHESSQSASSDFEEDFSNVCRCCHIFSCFYVAKGRACAVESCKNSALPSSGRAKSHEARELSDC